ncbi:MAG: UDPGP type 1 family protein [Clostridiales bacterium]|nr:UDPGP type 1 family protein [Eubacterium sp.]MDD7348856.1 UDPGP type 1 family protein [Clostridiales bacterium]MDY3774518.1 UDPGP type 1 family protein [Eubacterium sp.]
MRFEEAKQKCEKAGQGHLLAYFDELTGEEQVNLLDQIEKLDITLLDLLKKDSKEVEKGILEPLGAVTLEEIQQEKEEYLQLGTKAIQAGKVGAVLLAGGQGTRLGLDKPKGMLNVGVNKELYLFEQLIHNLMQVVDQTGAWVPLFVMTSEKNNEDTVQFFKEKRFFGYNEEYVFFFVQQMAPSVNYEGKIYMEDKGRISTSPNGNGGWFISMANAGLLKKVKELGVEWLNVFSVDNVLQKIADPIFVGAVLKHQCVSGSKVVAKADPYEKVGVLCLEDGKPSIVEYYEMTEEMIHLRDKQGKLLYNYGVILNYLFSVEALEKIVNENLPTHIVEKKIPYMDETGNVVKPEKPNGYKFETLVLDMIHRMDNCLSFEVEREKEFAPIKNATGVDSLESARVLMKKNGIEF